MLWAVVGAASITFAAAAFFSSWYLRPPTASTTRGLARPDCWSMVRWTSRWTSAMSRSERGPVSMPSNRFSGLRISLAISSP